MIPRTAAATLRRLAYQYPVVTVTGPRQSGKTTICRQLFADKVHVTLEDIDQRRRAVEDPRGFLASLSGGAVIDEVQHAPDLLSYIQGIVDADQAPGRFILTGSQNLSLLESVSQSLAGRTALLHLLPPSWRELRAFPNAPTTLEAALFTGSYPRILDQRLDASEWLADYVTTYVERDVRQILRVGDLIAFQTFLGLAAGRSGQVLNLAALGSDAGVDHKTAKAWLSVLETSFLVLRLPPFSHNLGKRWIKAPKLHFLDSGLLCYLLGIREPGQLRTHPLRGAIFESWVVSEIYKEHVHQKIAPSLFHWRDSRGLEVDLVVLSGPAATAVEAKVGRTIMPSAFESLDRFAALVRERDNLVGSIEEMVVFAGDEPQVWSRARVVPWTAVADLDWQGGGGPRQPPAV